MQKYKYKLYQISILLSVIIFLLSCFYFSFDMKILILFPILFPSFYLICEYTTTAVLMNFKYLSKYPNNENKKNLKSPSVTILLVTRNEPDEIILDTINSIKQIEYPANHLKVIISDNSDYNTFKKQKEKLLKEYFGNINIKFIHNEYSKNLVNGKAENLNRALKIIDTDFFLIADADSRFPKGILQSIKHLLHFPKIAIIQFRRIDSLQDLGVRSFISRLRHLFRDIIYEKYVAPCRFGNNFINFVGHNAIISTYVAKEIGGFNSNMLIEDSDFAIRVALAKYEIIYSEITTEDGKIVGSKNWFSRNSRLIYGKIQLFFTIILKYRRLPLDKFCSIFFHFGRFVSFYLLIIVFFASFFFNLVSFSWFIGIILLALFPGPLMPGSNIIIFLFFLVYSDEKIRDKYRMLVDYIRFSLILFVINILGIKSFLDYIIRTKYIFKSTQR